MQLTEADDDGVAPLEQRPRRGEPQLVQLLVDGRFLLDVQVAGRDVGLGLVVVVIGDEILDRIAGKELLELVEELRGERLVVRQDQRRAGSICSMTLAMVKVLPEPVTPSSV